MSEHCLWNLCNNNCIMCTNPLDFRKENDAKDYMAEDVLRRMEGERLKISKSGEDICLTGGETTIHPEFLYFLKKVKRNFPKNLISIATNGRRFFYEDFTKNVLKTKNLRLCVVVHSHEERTHDAIARAPGSFNQTIKGLENIFKYKDKTQMVELRVVLLKQNYKQLNDICKMFHEKFPAVERIAIIFPEYEGYAEKNFELIKITFSDVKEYVEETIKNWGEVFASYRLYHFPLCIFSHQQWPYLLRSLAPDHQEIFFMDRCERCYYKDCCLGVYKNYVQYFGEKEFKPIEREIKGIEKNLGNYQAPIISNIE